MRNKNELMALIPQTDLERYQYFREFLKKLPETMASEFSYLEVRKGNSILVAGSASTSVFFLLEGEIKGIDFYRTGSAYSFLESSGMYVLGDFELFSELPVYQASIYANTDCKLLRVSGEKYLRWIRHDENALFLRTKQILMTLTGERKKDREYLRMNCQERLMDFLTHYYENFAEDENRSIRVTLTQSELSEKIGFNLRSVQRAVASLNRSGLVLIRDGKMILGQEQYQQLRKKLDNEKISVND